MANAKKAKHEQRTSLKIGLEPDTRWNFSGHGKKLIILVLKWSNLTTLMNVLKQDNIE
jgi:hypothetical protein